MTDDADASLNSRHDKKRSPRSEMDGLESLRGEGKVRVDNKGALPPYNPRKRRKHKDKNQRKSKSMDSHLIVTPAIFKPGSMVLKTKENAKDY